MHAFDQHRRMLEACPRAPLFSSSLQHHCSGCRISRRNKRLKSSFLHSLAHYSDGNSFGIVCCRRRRSQFDCIRCDAGLLGGNGGSMAGPDVQSIILGASVLAATSASLYFGLKGDPVPCGSCGGNVPHAVSSIPACLKPQRRKQVRVQQVDFFKKPGKAWEP
ncbi:hypothetical protein KP509_11G077500 [Ceratopteris richardii]|uniref:Uncharacterized protein n=1 Tax=Ceratopteris richardii TaxID=49495 RepID=A0A8T2TT11_CERRI|nr:hypothetical protein KP509_11G077500 [Ceratopteris richardii]